MRLVKFSIKITFFIFKQKVCLVTSFIVTVFSCYSVCHLWTALFKCFGAHGSSHASFLPFLPRS